MWDKKEQKNSCPHMNQVPKMIPIGIPEGYQPGNLRDRWKYKGDLEHNQHKVCITRKPEQWTQSGWIDSKPNPIWGVLYTPPPFLIYSDGLWPDPANSNGLSWTIHWTSNGIHQTWPNSAACLVQVQWKSSEVTLKQKIIGLLLDFCWTSDGSKAEKRQNMTSP